MFLPRPFLAVSLLLPFLSCGSGNACDVADACVPQVLLQEDFEGENDNRYELNYTDFEQWQVVKGSVDLVGTPPFDDFLPQTQGMYVDLDGTTNAAGTLRTRAPFALYPGRYRLTFKMAGTPRPNQPDNTMTVSVGDAFEETITLSSYAPLQTFTAEFRVRSRTEAYLQFEHMGGDDYGNFIDDIVLERR